MKSRDDRIRDAARSTNGAEGNGGTGKRPGDAVKAITQKVNAAGPDAERAVCFIPEVVCLADVEPQAVPWLWPGRIPVGRLSLLVGRPGAGKSFLTCDIAARLSRAMPWPTGEAAPLGDTLLLSAEDDPGDTIVPRLIGAGADRRRVHLLTAIKRIELDGKERSVAFDRINVDMIGDALKRLPNAKLVVIDPVGNYLGGQMDMGQENEVRAVLRPLAALARELSIAILLVCHTRKASASFADDMAMGSRGFIGLARSVLHLTEDDGDKERKLLLPGKINICKSAPGLAFRMFGDPVRLDWEPEPLIGYHADDALANDRSEGSSRGPAPVRLEAAAEWLAEVLHRGPMSVNDLREQAKAAGLAWTTVRRAHELLGIVPTKQSFSGGWEWRLPANDLESANMTEKGKPEHLRGDAGESMENHHEKAEGAQVSGYLDILVDDGPYSERR